MPFAQAPTKHKIGAPAAPTKHGQQRTDCVGVQTIRFIHPMDSASCVGAFVKGRLASKLLNSRCPRLWSGRAEYGFLLTALGHINPRVPYTSAWKVLEVWDQLQSPKQAAAALPELSDAMMAGSFALNRPELAMVFCLCFAGCFRVGEALRLKRKDVVFSAGALILFGTNQDRNGTQGHNHQWQSF